MRNRLILLALYTEGIKTQRMMVRINLSENLNSGQADSGTYEPLHCAPGPFPTVRQQGPAYNSSCFPTSDHMPTAQWTPEPVDLEPREGKGQAQHH